MWEGDDVILEYVSDEVWPSSDQENGILERHQESSDAGGSCL